MKSKKVAELHVVRGEFNTALLSLDRLAARDIARQVGADTDPMRFVEEIVVPAMEQVGKDWENGTLSLSQIYMSGRICEQIVDEILPPATDARKTVPRMAICVLDDYHLLGKRIVYTTLRSGGFYVLDYGRVTTEEVLARVESDEIELLFISVLMLPSALEIGNLTAALRQRKKTTTVVVGGAPFRFDDQLWKEVGADAMGVTASDALRIANNAVGAHK